jgi:hypothetical protein
LPYIKYELLNYDYSIDPLYGYADVKYNKRAGIIDYKTNMIFISLTNCYIRGILRKKCQTNKHSNSITLKRNNYIIYNGNDYQVIQML